MDAPRPSHAEGECSNMALLGRSGLMRPYFLPLVLTPNQKLLLLYPHLNLPVPVFLLVLTALENPVRLVTSTTSGSVYISEIPEGRNFP